MIGQRRSRVRTAMRATALFATCVLLLVACGTGDSGDPDAAPEPTTPAEEAPEEDSPEPLTLRHSTHNPLTIPAVQALQRFADRANELSDGLLTIEIACCSEILPQAEVLQGVADGRADSGSFVAALFPAELPFAQVFSLIFVTDDVEAYSYTIQDMMQNHPVLVEEFEQNGVRPILVEVFGPSIMIASQSYPTLDSLRGERVRGFGFLSEALEMVGAGAVVMPGGEVYEALQRDLITAAVGIPMENVTQFGDVTSHFIDVGIGQYSASFVVMNQDVYDNMHPTLREAFDQAASEHLEQTVTSFMEFEDENCELMPDYDLEIELWSEEDKEEWREIAGDTFEQQWIDLTVENSGRDRAEVEDFLADYYETLERYEQESSYEPGLQRCAETRGDQ